MYSTHTNKNIRLPFVWHLLYFNGSIHFFVLIVFWRLLRDGVVNTDVLTGPNYCCQLLGYREMGCSGRGVLYRIWQCGMLSSSLFLPPTGTQVDRSSISDQKWPTKAAQMTEPEKWKWTFLPVEQDVAQVVFSSTEENNQTETTSKIQFKAILWSNNVQNSTKNNQMCNISHFVWQCQYL